MNTIRECLVNATHVLWKTAPKQKIVGEAQKECGDGRLGRHATAKPNDIKPLPSVGEQKTKIKG
jgi:hypothetical protein